jgi:hypothetical protein
MLKQNTINIAYMRSEGMYKEVIKHSHNMYFRIPDEFYILINLLFAIKILNN